MQKRHFPLFSVLCTMWTNKTSYIRKNKLPKAGCLREFIQSIPLFLPVPQQFSGTIRLFSLPFSHPPPPAHGHTPQRCPCSGSGPQGSLPLRQGGFWLWWAVSDTATLKHSFWLWRKNLCEWKGSDKFFARI